MREQLQRIRAVDDLPRDVYEVVTKSLEGYRMKSYRKELWFETSRRRELINITPQVADCLRESGITRRPAALQCHAHHRQCLHQ